MLGIKSHSARESQQFFVLISMSLAILVSLVSAFQHYQNESFSRIIEVDELITLRNYTWVGVDESGYRIEIRNIEDLDSLSPPTLKRLVLGIYCSLGRWTEPNNHVFHSLLTNFSLAATKSTLTGLRLPALISAFGFSILCALLCIKTGHVVAAPFVAAVASWHPYVVGVSESSRGYSLCLFLLTMWILLLLSLPKRPQSILLGTLMSLVAVSIFTTMVNLLVNWFLPVYFVVYLFPHFLFPKNVSKEEIVQIRRNLLIQFLSSSAVAFVFFMDRLPYLYSSALQYGVPIDSYREGASRIFSVSKYLFPEQWITFLICSLFGIFLTLKNPLTKLSLLTFGVSLVSSLLYYFLTMRFPYDRNFGAFLPLFLFGFSALIEKMVGLASKRVLYRGLFFFVLVIVSGSWLSYSIKNSQIDRPLPVLTEYLSNAQRRDDRYQFVIGGYGVTKSAYLYFPEEWNMYSIPDVDQQGELITVEKRVFPLKLMNENDPDAVNRFDNWPGTSKYEMGQYKVKYMPITWRKNFNDCDLNHLKCVIWKPAFESVAVSPKRLIDRLIAEGHQFHPIYNRYQVKMEIYNRLETVIITLPESSHDSVDQIKTRAESFQSIAREFGGDFCYLESSHAP